MFNIEQSNQSHEKDIKSIINMSKYKLTQRIIALSNKKTWDSAKIEWKLQEIYETDEPETCLCGHFPIIEICVLINNFNNNHASVGNCCVKKFLGLPSDKIFQSVKRVRKDNTKSLNAEALEHAYKKHWINLWERNFGIDTMIKRNLSEKQLATRIKINKKMLHNIKRTTSNQ